MTKKATTNSLHLRYWAMLIVLSTSILAERYKRKIERRRIKEYQNI